MKLKVIYWCRQGYPSEKLDMPYNGGDVVSTLNQFFDIPKQRSFEKYSDKCYKYWRNDTLTYYVTVEGR